MQGTLSALRYGQETLQSSVGEIQLQLGVVDGKLEAADRAVSGIRQSLPYYFR